MIQGRKRSGRRKERERALQTLYKFDISGGGAGLSAIPVEVSEPASYGKALSDGVTRNLNEIDRLIDRASKNWSLSRMGVVDRNILRIAVYELLYHGDVPCKVVLDEAIELANRFGAENSSSFINGIVDKVYRVILARRRPSMREGGQ